MPRVKRSTKRHDRRTKVLEPGQGLFRRQEPQLPHRQRGGGEVPPLRLPRPAGQKAGLPQPLDRPHQGRGRGQRHVLQPLHPRPEEPRHRSSTARSWPTWPSTRPATFAHLRREDEDARGLAPADGRSEGPDRRSPEEVRGRRPQGGRRQGPRGAPERPSWAARGATSRSSSKT